MSEFPHLNDQELQRLEAELGELAREITDEDVALVAPPEDLWDAIARETIEARPSLAVVDAHTGAQASGEVETPAAPATSSRDDAAGHRHGFPWLAVAAAIGLVLVAAGSLAVVNRNKDASVLVAQTEIVNDGLPVAFGQPGTAEVRRDGDDLYLVLDVPGLAETDTAGSYHEAWLIDTAVDGMVSLGVVDGEQRVDLPDDISVEEFPVVDISVEPLDGDPTHSGQSILRGILEL